MLVHVHWHWAISHALYISRWGCTTPACTHVKANICVAFFDILSYEHLNPSKRNGPGFCKPAAPVTTKQEAYLFAVTVHCFHQSVPCQRRPARPSKCPWLEWYCPPVATSRDRIRPNRMSFSIPNHSCESGPVTFIASSHFNQSAKESEEGQKGLASVRNMGMAM